MINEKLNNDYKYSCITIRMPYIISNDIMRWGRSHIKQSAIYNNSDDEHGFEDEIHCTVLYGLHDEKSNNCRKLISKNIQSFTITLNNITKFSCEKYDVIKIDVISSDLCNLHQFIKDNTNCSVTYSIYSPHITIAYVNKNSCDNLIGINYFKHKKFLVNGLIFSSFNGTDEKIKLKQ